MSNQKNNSIKYCCEHMEGVLDKYKVLSYSDAGRCYAIDLLIGANKELYYCPWCGTKLPKSLDIKWMQVLREEYGIKDPIFDDADKVPPEFHTDEWWKKRGL
ncbi:hypothetical protein NOVO_09065 [Rickettsiales bacterium Ac37b]|nr:hypothetical protein NOVO_09065 [Rickettsiales bacterium Ac37b]